MQQRRLRLGDILDDYCPRERRITNHAVVAMIEDQVKQTRCTTCDADHEYKEAKLPPPRRKKPGTALDVDLQGELRPVLAAPATAAPHEQPIEDESFAGDHDTSAEMSADASSEADVAVDSESMDEEPLDHGANLEDEGPVHRRLIRATLPRPEGQVPERKAPDFTMRQPRFNNNNSRNGQGNRGHRPMRAGQGQGGPQSRFGGQRQGAGPGGAQGQPRHGNRPGQPSGQRGGRPAGQNRGQRHGGGGQGRKRGR